MNQRGKRNRGVLPPRTGSWVPALTALLLAGTPGCNRDTAPTESTHPDEAQHTTRTGQPPPAPPPMHDTKTRAAPDQDQPESPPGPLPPARRVAAGPGKYEPLPSSLVPPPPDGGPFNVLFISLDTVRADALGCYGQPRFQTPTIDRLAASGVRFDQAITHIPETALSHWAIFTSVEPRLHDNVNRFGTSRYVGPLAQEIFKAHGYTTGAVIGGVTLRSDVGLHRGFDLYDEDFAFSPDRLKRPGREVTARAVDFIRNHAQVPFFLFVHYFDAHFPYLPPPPFDKAYDPDYTGTLDGSDKALAPFRDGKKTIAPRDLEHVKALYGGEVAFLDTQVRELLATLSEQGLGKNTLVVLFSDHGESFEHGYYFNHAGVLYDSTLHIPLIFSLPGVIPAGRVVETQVRAIDILPTVLQLLGLPGDVKFQGASLVPLVQGREQHIQAAFSLTDPWRPGALESVRTEGWKLILGPGDRQTLFEVSRDPDELHPIDGANHPIARVLADEHTRHAKQLEALAARIMGPRPAPRPELSPRELEQLKKLGYVR